MLLKGSLLAPVPAAVVGELGECRMEQEEKEEESEEDLAAVDVVIVLVGELGPPPPFEVATRLEEVGLLKLLL